MYGIGMSSEILHRALVLGYSTRYDSRKGMGRFGVGATLAGISQAKRLEIYSRSAGSPSYLYSYLDLEEIEKGQQTYMPEPRPSELPAPLAKMERAKPEHWLFGRNVIGSPREKTAL
jgi:hypothetical protein